MKIKELENELSISRSHIRFYEKQGLFVPERRENNYREYTDQDIAVLKKIIIFRKMGFSIEEIKLLQSNALPFEEAITNVQHRIEEEMEQLNGSLKLIKRVEKENASFQEIDTNEYWNAIRESEKTGEQFIDICKEFMELERTSFDNMWKYVFFHDFKKSRERFGTIPACIILFLICIGRGIASVMKDESFWSGFLYPFILIFVSTLIIFPLFLLSKKSPKVATIATTILLALAILFFGSIFLLFLGAIIAAIIA